MCDDDTELDNAAHLAKRGLGRREIGLFGASAALAAMPGCGPDRPATDVSDGAATTSTAPSSSAATPGTPTTSRVVTIETPDGKADAFFVTPASGKHAAVIMWPDIAGLRDAFRTMGTRLASAGYAVLVVNQYYRSSPAPVLTDFAEWRTDAGKAKLAPMIALVTPETTTRDAAAFVAWLDTQPEVDTSKKIGTAGYCMGGPFTFRTAAASPARVGALASLHGANLASDASDSPHLSIAKMHAALFVAIAQNDDEKQPDAKTKLREAADAAKLPAEIEVYPAQHGWCALDSPVYDAAQAEKAWARMLATFAAHL